MLWILVVSGAACAGDAPEVPVGPDGKPDPVLVVGREIYSGHCANCHGGSGNGNQGPKLADGTVVDAYPDLIEQRVIVSDGRDEMPSFANTLTEAEIEAVVRYTREVL